MPAGAVRVEVVSLDGTLITVDGESVGDAAHEVTATTVIEVGRHATVRVVPPGTGSVAAELKAGEGALADGLTRLGVVSHADAIAPSNNAKSANEAVRGQKRQVNMLCVADPVIGLAVGGAALRAILSTQPVDAAEEAAPLDLPALEAAQTRCSEDERKTLGRHNATVAQLRDVEEASRKLGLKLAGAGRDLANARAQITTLLQVESKPELETDLAAARSELADRLRDRVAAEHAPGQCEEMQRLGRVAAQHLAQRARRQIAS